MKLVKDDQKAMCQQGRKRARIALVSVTFAIMACTAHAQMHVNQGGIGLRSMGVEYLSRNNFQRRKVQQFREPGVTYTLLDAWKFNHGSVVAIASREATDGITFFRYGGICTYEPNVELLGSGSTVDEMLIDMPGLKPPGDWPKAQPGSHGSRIVRAACDALYL